MPCKESAKLFGTLSIVCVVSCSCVVLLSVLCQPNRAMSGRPCPAWNQLYCLGRCDLCVLCCVVVLLLCVYHVLSCYGVVYFMMCCCCYYVLSLRT